MSSHNKKSANGKYTKLRVCAMIALLLPWHVWASFYQSTTLASYCKEYLKLIRLENPVNQLEAGICSGYTASKIEVMNLSGQLCQRDKVNLNDVVSDYVDYLDSNTSLSEKSATYVMVDLLERNYSCKDSD